jgi:type I phosphodiesterase/nucleotide pyrophosphatase
MTAPDRPAPATAAADLLRQVELPRPGLYRRHPERNLGAVAAAIADGYRGTGPVRLGPRRSLVVIAVDGLGYPAAARALTPDVLFPLTSEFPTTTVACLLTSVTRQAAGAHGFIGVQYLHADGRRTVNCHDGRTTDPSGPGPVRPTRTPDLATVFDELALAGVPTVLLLNELAALDADVLRRMTRGARLGRGAPLPSAVSPPALVDALGEQLTEHVMPGAVTWAYADLDRHIHQHGFDPLVQEAAAGLDRLARRLRDEGVAVLLFSDHGLTRNQASPATLGAWTAATGERYCRLPAGGAGRTRWVYPHPRHEDRLAAWLARDLPDAIVTTPGQLAAWGLVADGGIGQRRLGEIILLARGPDFPVPDVTSAFEHGSMTAAEVLAPLAVWSPA